jgi:hypothetical protein
MPHCQFPIFYCFSISEKLHMKYSRNWMKQKLKFLFFLTRDEPQSRDGGEPGVGHTIGQCGPAPGRDTRWWGHLAHLLTPPLHLYILFDEKNPRANHFFQKTYRESPLLLTRDREGLEALFSTLPEHHHACLRSDV